MTPKPNYGIFHRTPKKPSEKQYETALNEVAKDLVRAKLLLEKEDALLSIEISLHQQTKKDLEATRDDRDAAASDLNDLEEKIEKLRADIKSKGEFLTMCRADGTMVTFRNIQDWMLEWIK